MVKDKQSFAFTLIELLIVFFIIFIFGGVSIAFYHNFTQEQQLRNEAKKFVDVLELAKKKTTAGDYLNAPCSGYGYRVEINSNNYRLRVCCYDLNNTCNSNQLINTFNVSNNIQFQSTYYVRFLPLTNKIESNLNFPITSFIKNQSIGKCVEVGITQFGIIDLNESLTSC